MDRRNIFRLALLCALLLLLLPSLRTAHGAPPVINPGKLQVPVSLLLNAYGPRLDQIEDNATLDLNVSETQNADPNGGGLDWSHSSNAAAVYGRIGGYLQTGWWFLKSTSASLQFRTHFSYLSSVFADPVHADGFAQDDQAPFGNQNISDQFSNVGDRRIAYIVQHQVPPFTRVGIDFVTANVEVEIGLNTFNGLSPSDVKAMIANLHAVAAAVDSLIVQQVGTATPTPTSTPTNTPTATATLTPTTTPTPIVCQKGYKVSGGKCVKNAPSTPCKKDYKRVHGQCRRVVGHRVWTIPGFPGIGLFP